MTQYKRPLISAVILLFLTLAALWVLYTLFGHSVIRTIYEGRSISILNSVIGAQDRYPLEHYFRIMDRAITPTILYAGFFMFVIAYFLNKIAFSGLSYGAAEQAPNRTIDIILFCFLAISAIKLTYLIETTMDIGLYDESCYLDIGVKVTASGLPPAQIAPLYSVWYYLLSIFEKNNIRLYYLNYKLLISFTTLIVYVYLRRIEILPFVAAIFSFLYLVSGCSLFWPWIVHFALAILLLFFILASFTKSKEDYYIAAGLGILTISFARPEYTVSFILFCVAFLFYIPVRLKKGFLTPMSAFVKIFIFVLITASLFHIFGNPLSGPRNWNAFRQHFSLNYVEWNNSPVNSWTNSEQITRAVFGESDSVIGAAAGNPKEFFRHFLYNAGNYVRNSLTAFFVTSDCFGVQEPAELIKYLEFLCLIVIGIYLLKKKAQLFKKIDYLSIFLLLYIPAILSSILIYPRGHYLIIQTAMIMIILADFISKALTDGSGIKQAKISAALLLGMLIFVLTPNLSACRSFISNEDTGKEIVRREILPNLKTIEFIQSLNITGKVNMLEAEGGYDIYLGDNFKRVAEYDKKESFNKFILDHKINMIVLSERLKNDTRFFDDKEFKYFLEQPQALGFRKFGIFNTGRYLFVKDR